MTGPGDDIAARVQRLEREVAQLRERLAESAGDAAAARVLASGADRDVSEVRAELRSHLRILNALRETQLEFQGAQQEFRGDLQGFRGELQGFRGELQGFRDELADQRTQVVALGEAQRELRGTVLEQGVQISTLREDVTALRTEMREGFATVHTGMSHIVALLTNIERDQP